MPKQRLRKAPADSGEDQKATPVETFLNIKRNQVLYSAMTEQYYFVPLSRPLPSDPRLHEVSGKKINVTESVRPLVGHAVAGHLRELARSSAFDAKGRRKLLATARAVEKNVGIDASDHEG